MLPVAGIVAARHNSGDLAIDSSHARPKGLLATTGTMQCAWVMEHSYIDYALLPPSACM